MGLSIGLNVLLLFLKVSLLAILRLPIVLVGAAISTPVKAFKSITLQLEDFGLLFLNIISPLRPIGGVIPKGKPGYGGIWPPYIAPTDQDSRSPCPGLNALSNHGILNRDGRYITMDALKKAINETYNFAPTLCQNSADSVVGLFGRDHIDLSDLNSHNIIEHDASLIRHDAFFAPDQAPPARDLISKFLAAATGSITKEHPEGQVTIRDFSRFLSIRRAQSKRDNPTFKLTALHKFFSSSNGSLLYETWGQGDVASLKKMLYEEKLVDGFEPGMRHRYGFTMTEFHLRNFEIALGIDNSIKL